MIELYDGSLQFLGSADHVVKWGYEQKCNELSTASIVLPAGADAAGLIDVPATFARLYDGDEDLGFYRFTAMPAQESRAGGRVTYSLQSAQCTLLDSMMTGWHEIGGTGFPTRRVMEYILARQQTVRWVLGTCEFEEFYQYNFEDVTLLEALMSLGEVLLEDYLFVFDSTATPWTVHLLRVNGEAVRSLVCGRNMTGIRRSVEGAVVTRLHGRGYGEGDNQLTIASVNGGKAYIDAPADAIARWGIREGVHVDTRQTSAATLKARMQQILAAGCVPAVSYEADAIDLYRVTGESWDDVRCGERVLVLDEMLGAPVTVRVTSRKKDDAEGDPGAVSYVLDNSRPDTAEELNEIYEKIGVHELYSQGATNMYSMQTSENADASHPLAMRFYVPGNVLRINSCRISWQLEAFRTHVTLARSGGRSSRTSEEGGGMTVTIPARIVTRDVLSGGPVDGSGAEHLVSGGMLSTGGGTNITLRTGAADAQDGHTHSVPNHTHEHDHLHNAVVSVDIPAMSVMIEGHRHTVNIPEHEHELQFGIYESGRAGNMSLVVDGTAVPASAIGDGREIDVAAYLKKDDAGKVTRGAWHEVKFVPDGLTRITANLFFQVFIQSRGAGDY